MTDSTQGPDTGVDRPRKGLAARAAGVIFSPRETYAEVAARPRAFGILALAILLMAGLQGWLLSTARASRHCSTASYRPWKRSGPR